MKALTWHGAKDVRINTVPDPEILEPGDMREKLIPICNPDLGWSLFLIGDCYKHLGKYELAEQAFKRSIKIGEPLAKKESAYLSSAQAALAECVRLQNK